MVSQDSYPDESLNRLQKIAEDIPSGVSVERVKYILKAKLSQELHAYLNNVIIENCKQPLQRIWTEQQIADKLTHLKELEQKSPKTEAWRPVTGKVDVNPFVAHRLLKEKEALIKKVDNLKTESAMNRRILENFREKFHHQMEEIRTITKTCVTKEIESAGREV